MRPNASTVAINAKCSRISVGVPKITTDDKKPFANKPFKNVSTYNPRTINGKTENPIGYKIAKRLPILRHAITIGGRQIAVTRTAAKIFTVPASSAPPDKARKTTFSSPPPIMAVKIRANGRGAKTSEKTDCLISDGFCFDEQARARPHQQIAPQRCPARVARNASDGAAHGSMVCQTLKSRAP